MQRVSILPFRMHAAPCKEYEKCYGKTGISVILMAEKWS
ncbi:hypothetical protein AC07_4158 [Escherichia coli 3-475-03_S3_C1]|nr:hypothetical protein EC179100_4507 [Escherichia coli 179100]KEK74978.1 hypothetical protein AC07_4158 [Escherichia coli 3-475-03_S3_C1]